MVSVRHAGGVSGIDWKRYFSRQCGVQVGRVPHKLGHNDTVKRIELILAGGKFLVSFVFLRIATCRKPAIGKIALL